MSAGKRPRSYVPNYMQASDHTSLCSCITWASRRAGLEKLIRQNLQRNFDGFRKIRWNTDRFSDGPNFRWNSEGTSSKKYKIFKIQNQFFLNFSTEFGFCWNFRQNIPSKNKKFKIFLP